MKTIRCAIYTRKSSEEGLEQDFNSLDAQREACAAYVLSQASEGWKLIPASYDDGGLSGGTLERPALQRLLADVNDGRIDIIVVYKVDRLTRSLLDFAKLVEVFDGAGTSFVSVTQSFNTTNSMGRLTLNMLLSFAQFEREVTAERIRDKIAASKARGMWMGGIPPLGYRPDGRSLAIVEDQAQLIRGIYHRYLELGTVRALAEALQRENLRTPIRTTDKGFTTGGRPFSRGHLYAILKNPVYAGRIAHKDKVWPGNHPALIDQETWDRVQQLLAEHTQGTRTVRERSKSMLAGLLFDAQGVPLITAHTTKGRQRYRYYVRRSDHGRFTGPSSSPALRIPAEEIEQVIVQALTRELSQPLALLAECQVPIRSVHIIRLSALATMISGRLASDHGATVRSLVPRIEVHADRLELEIDPAVVATQFELAAPAEHPASIRRTLEVRLTRTRKVGRLIEANGVAASARPDQRLIRHLLKARSWWQELARGEIDVTTLALREGVTASYLTRIVRLQFLAPSITAAILAGEVKEEVGSRMLSTVGAITPSWRKQEERYLPG